VFKGTLKGPVTVQLCENNVLDENKTEVINKKQTGKIVLNEKVLILVFMIIRLVE